MAVSVAEAIRKARGEQVDKSCASAKGSDSCGDSEYITASEGKHNNSAASHDGPFNALSYTPSQYSCSKHVSDPCANGTFNTKSTLDSHRNNMPMTPSPGAQFGGNTGFNPNANANMARYQPPQRRVDPIIRPESSISNHTFATQLPGMPTFTPSMYGAPVVQHPRPIAPYDNYQKNWQEYGNSLGSGINGFSAGLSTLQVGGQYSSQYNPQMALPTLQEGSQRDVGGHNAYITGERRTSSSSRQDSLLRYQNASAHKLAVDIIRGSAEDPNDRMMSRYDTAPKPAAPHLGPARFKDTKMFSVVDPEVPVDASVASSSAASLQMVPSIVPDWLELATRGMCKPNLDEAFDGLPFTELPRQTSPSTAGIIRVSGIPYGTTKQEMTAFVGRNAQVLRMPGGSPYHAVHIMMERETGKTQDCFVELASPAEAVNVMRQFQRRIDQNRPPKVGDRVVGITFCSQDEFLTELFPRAKHVRWSGGHPIVDQTAKSYYKDTPAAGFGGFFHPEEFVMMEKHASLGERSPFASKSPSRVYENMISLLYKYPWHATDLVLAGERRTIYDTCVKLVRNLIDFLRHGRADRHNPLDPSPALLQELTVAVLGSVGFSERQKAAVVQLLCQNSFKSMVEAPGINVKLGGMNEFSHVWPFAALSVVPGTDRTLLRYYAQLFRDATINSSSGSLAERKAAKNGPGYPMGKFTIEYGANSQSQSLAQIAKTEYNIIEKLLTRVLGNQPSNSPLPSSRGSNASYSSYASRIVGADPQQTYSNPGRNASGSRGGGSSGSHGVSSGRNDACYSAGY